MITLSNIVPLVSYHPIRQFDVISFAAGIRRNLGRNPYHSHIIHRFYDLLLVISENLQASQENLFSLTWSQGAKLGSNKQGELLTCIVPYLGLTVHWAFWISDDRLVTQSIATEALHLLNVHDNAHPRGCFSRRSCLPGTLLSRLNFDRFHQPCLFSDVQLHTPRWGLSTPYHQCPTLKVA